MTAMLWTLTWILAVAGALLSVVAVWAKAKGLLSPAATGRMNLGSYICLGLSVGLFVLRGFLV